MTHILLLYLGEPLASNTEIHSSVSNHFINNHECKNFKKLGKSIIGDIRYLFNVNTKQYKIAKSTSKKMLKNKWLNQSYGLSKDAVNYWIGAYMFKKSSQ